MKNEDEKKGLFGRLIVGKKVKKSSCCCNIEFEELPDETEDGTEEKIQK